MNLKENLQRRQIQQEGDDDLNITPVMNVFLILVPFLLLTAVFVNIAIVEFSLPSSNAAAREQSQQRKNTVVTILAITEKGFELKTKGQKFPFIEKKDGIFDYQILIERLQEVKQKHAESEDIIIAPESTIKYDTIIQVMDRCRENGFPNISISA